MSDQVMEVGASNTVEEPDDPGHKKNASKFNERIETNPQTFKFM